MSHQLQRKRSAASGNKIHREATTNLFILVLFFFADEFCSFAKLYCDKSFLPK
jgi:hypothetical protein